MSGFANQIALLRRRMAAAARRADRQITIQSQSRKTAIASYKLEGSVVESRAGRHLERDRLWENWRHHGSVDIGSLAELPPDLFVEISADEIPPAPPETWAFVDTETTGLAGGSGTCAFLIGIGRITPAGFRVRQYFMRDFDEEASQLGAVAEALADAQVVVTYNGKSFDVPLLETRYRMNRTRPPFARLAHLDLLHGARRLWRLRMESCRLVELESRVLGYTRYGDVPGEMIPRIYFDYLNGRGAEAIEPVFEHNALDIVSLACLAAIVPWAFRDPAQAVTRHPAECVALGRWLRRTGRTEEALALLRSAVAGALRDDLLFRTLWDIAGIERTSGRYHAALAVYAELAASRNPYRVAALEQLAKHYEHRERNFAMALEFTAQAFALADNAALRRRLERLRRRAAAPPVMRLL